MDTNWTDIEFGLTDLGDKRLNKRLIEIAGRFADSPESPINQACCNWAETKAAYRFFKNDSVDYKKIIYSHIENTKIRCNAEKVILAIQDTTYLTYTSHKKTTGLCPVARKSGKYKENLESAGLIIHSSLAVSSEGLPLGLLDQKIYSRPQLSNEMKEIKKRTHNAALAIEEKDSFRWVELLRSVSKHKLSVEVITVCDREGDIYEMFLESEENDSKVLIRANHDRTVNKKSIHAINSGEKLWEFMKKEPVKGNIDIKIPEKENEASRVAALEVRYKKFTLNAPKNKNKNAASVNLTAIYLIEKNPPENSERIEWMLLTNHKVENLEDALEKIKWYCLRWRIEVFHKILKSGFKVEDCRLSDAERLIRYLAVTSIVAWRVFWITMIARVTPDANCLFIVSELEWKILFAKMNPKHALPKQLPTVKEIANWIAKLGGFLGRKCDKEPGVIYIWRGLNKLADILEGVELAKDICG